MMKDVVWYMSERTENFTKTKICNQQWHAIITATAIKVFNEETLSQNSHG